MSFVYSALAFAEVCVLFASIIGVVVLIVRLVYRALFPPKEEKKSVKQRANQTVANRPATQSR